MPQVVLVIPDRALRLVWEYAFAAAGWRTHTADTTIDALAVAFNVDADALVTTLADASGASTGLDLVREFAADVELKDVPRYLLAPAGLRLADADATIFAQPCDPYWLIVDADTHLGRTTPTGLGHRPLSHDDRDVAIHSWWWTLAATDLIRQALRHWREHHDLERVLLFAGERLGQRIGAEVALAASHPEGKELALWRPEEASVRTWLVSFGEAGWWRIIAPEEGLTVAHIECIGALAAALGNVSGSR